MCEVEDHVHCGSCVRVLECRSLSLSTGVEKCAVKCCLNGCGFWFHSCKEEEHISLLCPNARVPCINVAYGCPQTMPRSRLGIHLSTCPASVVVCHVWWTRFPIRQGAHMLPGRDMVRYAADGARQLDVCLALRDQHTAEKTASLQLSRRCCSFLRYPVPIKSPGCITRPVLNGDEQEMDCYDNYNESPPSPLPTPPSIPSPPTPPPYPLFSQTSLWLDLTTEYWGICNKRGRPSPKRRSKYTFQCGQEFRRDEVASHWKNTHDDICGGWMEQRCPLAIYGCTHAVRRLEPKLPKGATVVFNEHMGCPGVAHFVESAADEGQRKIGLCQLPYDILEQVIRRLDSFSLCNLAMTCRRLRSVCYTLLLDRGIVVCQWERQGGSSWVLTHKHWKFSPGFEPVTRWTFKENRHMADHLQTCAFYDRNEHDQVAPTKLNFPPLGDQQAVAITN